MIFTDEYSLIDGNRLESSFRAYNTQFDVVQGQISAIVSKSGIDKMQSGDQSIYEQMSAIKQSTTSISAVVSDMNEYVITDPETGQTTPATLKSKIANMDLTASKIELSVSDIENDYTTEEKLNRAISSHRAQIKLENGTVKMVTDSYDGGRWSSSSVDLGDEIRLQTTGPIVWNADNSTMTDRGTLTCNAGDIGGWKIERTRLYGGNSSVGYAFLEQPAHGNDYVLAAGTSASPGECEFSVDRTGKLRARDIITAGIVCRSSLTSNAISIDKDQIAFYKDNPRQNYAYISANNGNFISINCTNKELRLTSTQIFVGTMDETFQCLNSGYYYLPTGINSDGTVAGWRRCRVYHGLIL